MAPSPLPALVIFLTQGREAVWLARKPYLTMRPGGDWDIVALRKTFGAVAALTGVAVLLAGTVQPVQAFELFGFRFFGSADEAPEDEVIGEPQAYEATVETGTAPDEAADAVRNASRLWADRDEPASGTAGLISKAKGDYQRILAGLYAEGHYGPTISILIDGREANGLSADTDLAQTAQVVIAVDVGPRFAFGQTAITNEAPPTAVRGDRVARPSEEGFAPGEVARSTTILRAERLATEAWRQQGHAKAEIADRSVTANHPIDTVDVTIAVAPGPKAYYGRTTVSGTSRMNPDFVARMAGLPEGQEFDPDDLDDGRNRLARLDVFRSLTVREADEIAANGLLPISVDVQERPLRRLGIGGTYSTLDGLGIDTFWLHRNLFGQAERLRLDARVGGIGDTLDVNQFNYNVGATYTQPGTFTIDTDLVASVIGRREVLDAYTENSVTARLGVTHIFYDILSGEIFGEVKYGEFRDGLGDRSFLTAGLPTKLILDTRDNTTDPTEGFYLEGLLEPFYEFEFGNAAARGTVEGRTYFGLDAEDRFILAGRLKLGALTGPDIGQIPPDKLFFSGGGGSTRGYEFRGIGVRDASGVVTGGRSLIEGSVEARAKVTETIGLVGFVDAGYVGADSFPAFSEDVQFGAGVGLRYYTGLGPIRLDVATPLNPGPRDPDFALYVGIGQAF
jgi:translocation and assembly module TamA